MPRRQLAIRSFVIGFIAFAGVAVLTGLTPQVLVSMLFFWFALKTLILFVLLQRHTPAEPLVMTHTTQDLAVLTLSPILLFAPAIGIAVASGVSLAIGVVVAGILYAALYAILTRVYSFHIFQTAA